MGTWGPGNFDDDSAADHLSTLTDRLIAEIATAMDDPANIEPDEYGGVLVPCNVELLCLIARQNYVGASLPEVETIAAWKTTYLSVWEGHIDGLKPKRGFKESRRAVLMRTFDELAKLAEARSDLGPKKR